MFFRYANSIDVHLKNRGPCSAQSSAASTERTTLVVKSNTTLHLDAGTTVLASGDLKDYLKHGAVLYAKDAENIVLTEQGVLDGLSRKVRVDRRNSSPTATSD